MALNPNIALSVNPPQPIDIAGAYRKAQELSNLQRQEEIQKQTIQQNAQALRDDQLVIKSWIESDGDDNKFIKRIKTAGVSPDTVLKYEAAYENKRKALADTKAEELKAKQSKWGNLRSLMLPVLDEKDNAKAAAMMNKAYGLAKSQGLMDDEEINRIQSIMDKGWNREDAQMYINSLTSDVNLSKEIEREQKAQIGMLKAQGYAQNIQSLMDARGAKSVVDLKKLDIAAQELQRKIEADINLDDYRRSMLSQELIKHRQNLAQRIVEE